MDLPLLVRVGLGGVTNPTEIDTEIYCVNHTGQPLLVAARSTSFTTVDEESGSAAHHGSRPTQILIGPGEAKMVGDVVGWEWDGAVGMELRFRPVGVATGLRVGYNLRRPGEPLMIEALGERGHLIPPSFVVPEDAAAKPGSAGHTPLLERLLRWLRER
ncbi:MAG: hypothetical protein OHK0022_31300 [Roseiflexaceae bacterium]